MNIQYFLSRCKEVLSGDLAVVALIILVGIGGFSLGRLSVDGGEKSPLKIVYPEKNTATAVQAGETASPSTPIEGGVVASRSGSKYHLPWCSGASSISEANKIWFATPEAARAKGYTPAANCPGIQ